MDLPDLRARLMKPKEYLISNMFLYSDAVDTKHTPVALKNGYKTNVLYMERHSDHRQENIPDISHWFHITLRRVNGQESNLSN